MKRVGILTGGGDAPGLNAVIYAIVNKAAELGWEVIGFIGGWAGLMNDEKRVLRPEDVEDIVSIGGTIIFTTRTNPYKHENGPQKCVETFRKNNLDALIAIGGEDTLGVANKLHKEFGLPIVGVPKTIDNDLSGTDQTFGFDTAINRIAEAIDWLHTTARSHRRVMVVEVMGRHAGWLALYGGLAGGAHFIAIPEVPFSIDELCELVKRRKQQGKTHTMVVIAEGAKLAQGEIYKSTEVDEFGHPILGGVGEAVAKEIKNRTGLEVRHVVLGHLQRGGSPSAFDRFLGIAYGTRAMELVSEGKFGRMVALKGKDVSDVPLEEAVAKLKTVPPDLYNTFKYLFRA